MIAQIIWIILIIAFAVGEIVTVGLTSIWFAGGALAALIVSAFGANEIVQIVVFLVVSLLLLFFTRPWALKYLKPHLTRTNYEEAWNQKVTITQTIDNVKGTGTAVLKGQEWTARAYEDDIIIEAGTMATVQEIRGVTLYVVPIQTEQEKVEES